MSTTALQTLSVKLAERFGLGADGGVLDTLKATAFKGPANDAQMTALLIVAQQYGLNPFTKEIYAFPDKNNGIVPVVGVDGWSRIINSHPQFDGMDFEQDAESCTCIIYRKDRSHPVRVTEWLSECKRETGPWKSHPRRMLRHKAMIQCARLAFGFVGIYEQDEAERIVEGQLYTYAEEPQRPALEPYPQERFQQNIEQWSALIQSGRKSAAELVAMLETRAVLSENQRAAIFDLEPIDAEAQEINA